MTIQKKQNGVGGPSGTFLITPRTIDDQVATHENMDPALRVRCDIAGQPDDGAVLFVPMSEKATYKLSPFAGQPITETPQTEAGWRALVERSIIGRTVHAYVQDGKVRSVLLEPGTHMAKFYRMFTYTAKNKRGAEVVKARIVLQSADFREVSFPTSFTGVLELDAAQKLVQIGGDTLWTFGYLKTLGFDYDRFIRELEEADAEGRLFKYQDAETGADLDGFFGGDEPYHAARALTEAVHRHGAATVMVPVVDDPQWGLGVQNVNKNFVMVPVPDSAQPVQSTPQPQDDAEYASLVEYLEQVWQSLTEAILGDGKQLMDAEGDLTEDGVTILKGIYKPILEAHKQFMIGDKTYFPPTPQDLHKDGVDVMSFVAERLLDLDQTALFETVNLTNPGSVLQWAEANVPKLAAQPMNKREEL